MTDPAATAADAAAVTLASTSLDGAPATTPTAAEGAPSKSAAKANARAEAKEAKRRAEAAAAAERKAAAEAEAAAADPLADRYGDAPLVASQAKTGRVWARISDLSPDQAGHAVLLRARVDTVRGKGKSCFIVLRQRTETIQLVLFSDDVTVSRNMVKYASNLPRESVVDVEGTLSIPASPVSGCTQTGVELKALAVRAISRAEPLPFDLVDAGRPDAAAAEDGAAPAGPTVAPDTRLDARVVDLRVPAMNAVFVLQAAVGRLFRSTMDGLGFQEIHSPCLIAGASEGGAACFRLDYCGRPACLAQSPQLYKQMALCADFERVYEVTPVFRAEKSFTHRHLTEFTGLDFEMCINEHYDEVLDVIDTLFVALFDGLNAACAKELAVIGKQYPFKPLRYLKKTLRLSFAEGIQLLVDSGHPVPDPMADLNTEAERRLGSLVADKYGTDFFILTRFPAAIRPFYTMPDPADPAWSNSFDVFIRGEEIISGAQRIHDPAMLAASATAAGIPLDTIADYVAAFRYGAPPHGGAGVGLERVVMLFCGLDNIRKASLFPRDPKRLTP